MKTETRRSKSGAIPLVLIAETRSASFGNVSPAVVGAEPVQNIDAKRMPETRNPCGRILLGDRRRIMLASRAQRDISPDISTAR